MSEGISQERSALHIVIVLEICSRLYKDSAGNAIGLLANFFKG